MQSEYFIMAKKNFKSKMIIETINSTISSGKYQQILSVIKGCRNGAVYGTKVRFPNALVMTLLFKRDECILN
jgi:hypothetical protein